MRWAYFLPASGRTGHVRVGVVAGDAEHPCRLRAFGNVLVARLRHDGGTPRASAISRAAVWRASIQSVTFGLSDMDFQSSPPSRSSGLLLARLRQDGYVGIGVVAGDAEQHWRHAERKRDLAGGDVAGLKADWVASYSESPRTIR